MFRPLRRPADLLRGGPMKTGGFRLLVAGQFTSGLGDYCYAVALPWLLLSLRGGTVLLGTVLAFYGVPRIAAMPIGGALADRIGGVRVMLCADALRAAATLVLTCLAVARSADLSLLGPASAVLGLGSGLFTPASYTVLPKLLPADQVGTGFALSTMVSQFAGVIGPALGGILVAAVGPAVGLGVDAGSYLVSAGTLLAMSLTAVRNAAVDPEADGEAGPRADQAGDESAVSRNAPTFGVLIGKAHLLHVILVVALMSNLVYCGTMEVALPDLARMHFGALGYGTLLTVLSIGALVGSALAMKNNGIKALGYLFAMLGVVMGGSLAVLPYAGGVAGAAAAVAVYAVASGWQNVAVGVMLQTWTPANLLGRTMSVIMIAVQGAFPVSTAIGGLEVRRLGAAPFFPIAGCAIAVSVLCALGSSSFRRYRLGDTFTLQSAAEPEAAVV